MIAVFAIIWVVMTVIIFYGGGFYTGILYVDLVAQTLRITDIRELGLLIAVAVLWPVIVVCGIGVVLLALFYPHRAQPRSNTGTTIRTPKA